MCVYIYIYIYTYIYIYIYLFISAEAGDRLGGGPGTHWESWVHAIRGKIYIYIYKILLESDPLKFRILTRRLAAASIPVPGTRRESQQRPAQRHFQVGRSCAGGIPGCLGGSDGGLQVVMGVFKLLARGFSGGLAWIFAVSDGFQGFEWVKGWKRSQQVVHHLTTFENGGEKRGLRLYCECTI